MRSDCGPTRLAGGLKPASVVALGGAARGVCVTTRVVRAGTRAVFCPPTWHRRAGHSGSTAWQLDPA